MQDAQASDGLPGSYADCMTAGIHAAEGGQRDQARCLFHRAVELEPERKDAWLWLAGLSADPREAIRYLRRALAIDPNDQAALDGMEWAAKRLSQQAVAAPEEPPSERRAVTRWPLRAARPLILSAWIVVLVAVIIVAAIVTPSAYHWVIASARPTSTPTPTNLEKIDQWRGPLERAWQDGNWPVVITTLERIRSVEPDYGGLGEWLTAAYTNYGRSLAVQQRWDEARQELNVALTMQPDYAPAQDQVKAINSYLDGVAKHNLGDWQGARQSLQVAYEIDPGYPNVQSLLYDACFGYGMELQAAGDLLRAKEAYEAALGLFPDAQDAQQKLAEVNYLLTPPTPTPTPVPAKTIIVDISEQRMYVYEGDVLIWKWVCSTGEPARPTRTGTFAVQSKIPEAYSSVWQLRMPYWLGIYWAGASENGIHALPINPNGTTLWSGFLGYQVSFGCIILDTPNAQTLYDWAEIGTTVVIRP
jgi:tetratricopeptide (TPR) repeat protein